MSAVIRQKDAFVMQVPGRCIKVYSTPQTSSIKSMLTCTTQIPPGEQLPYHKHDGEDEVMFFMRGQGHVVLDGVEEPIAAGELFCAPKGCMHTVKNTGTEELYFCCAFSPPLDMTPYMEKAKEFAAQQAK